MNNSNPLKFISEYLFRKRELRCVEQRYDPEHFGNAFIVLENKEIKIRVLLDRGQIFADIMMPADEISGNPTWQDIGAFLSQLSDFPRKNVAYWSNPQELAYAIDQYYPQLRTIGDA